MSLINDALKRAKQAHDQQAAPPVRSAPLHTVPPPAPSLVWPLTILVVALAAIIIGVAVFWQKTKINPAPAVAQTQPAPQSVAVAPAPAPTAFVEPAPVRSRAGPAPTPAPVAASVAPRAEPVGTPPAAAPVSEPPAADAFPTVRLQGILYQPGRPAAIINGRTLFIGDRLADITVIAINQSSATLVWNGVTNVLSLP